jgi:hypothetical protein
MLTTLLRCYDCNRLLSLGPHNRAPGWSARVDPAEDLEIPWDDEEDFRLIHAGHRLGEVRIREGTAIGKGCWGDPTRAIWFEATDGRETILVRRHRMRIDRPAVYEVIPGRLVSGPGAPEVQARDLRRQLDFDLGDKVPATIRGRFVAAVEEVAAGLFAEDLENVGADPQDALVEYARLGEDNRAQILDRLRDSVPEEILRRLHRFMIENMQGNDVMNLRLRKSFFIREQEVRNPQARRA